MINILKIHFDEKSKCILQPTVFHTFIFIFYLKIHFIGHAPGYQISAFGKGYLNTPVTQFE